MRPLELEVNILWGILCNRQEVLNKKSAPLACCCRSKKPDTKDKAGKRTFLRIPVSSLLAVVEFDFVYQRFLVDKVLYVL